MEGNDIYNFHYKGEKKVNTYNKIYTSRKNRKTLQAQILKANKPEVSTKDFIGFGGAPSEPRKQKPELIKHDRIPEGIEISRIVYDNIDDLEKGTHAKGAPMLPTNLYPSDHCFVHVAGQIGGETIKVLQANFMGRVNPAEFENDCWGEIFKATEGVFDAVTGNPEVISKDDALTCYRDNMANGGSMFVQCNRFTETKDAMIGENKFSQIFSDRKEVSGVVNRIQTAMKRLRTEETMYEAARTNVADDLDAACEELEANRVISNPNVQSIAKLRSISEELKKSWYRPLRKKASKDAYICKLGGVCFDIITS